MLSKFFLFYILSIILGNPFIALLILILIYIAVDRAFIGFIPSPMALFRRSGRIKELRKLIAINPHDARSLKELGVILSEKGDYKKALGYFEKAAKRMSDDPEFNYYYGITAAKTGDIQKGRELVDAAVKASSSLKYGEPYLMMAEVYIDTGDYRSALPLLEQFEKIHTSSSRGFYQMGLVKLRLGEKDEGIKYLKKSVSAFRASPRFKRKLDRKWAWKARALLRKAM